MSELLIFGAFGLLQVVFHQSHKLQAHPVLYKLSHKPWLVWILHPTVAHTVQDYAIHVVIYSGKVFSGH